MICCVLYVKLLMHEPIGAVISGPLPEAECLAQMLDWQAKAEAWAARSKIDLLDGPLSMCLPVPHG